MSHSNLVGVKLETIDAGAKTEALDALRLPLELGLQGLPEFTATPEVAVRLKKGNPGQAIGHTDWGTEG